MTDGGPLKVMAINGVWMGSWLVGLLVGDVRVLGLGLLRLDW